MASIKSSGSDVVELGSNSGQSTASTSAITEAQSSQPHTGRNGQPVSESVSRWLSTRETYEHEERAFRLANLSGPVAAPVDGAAEAVSEAEPEAAESTTHAATDFDSAGSTPEATATATAQAVPPTLPPVPGIFFRIARQLPTYLGSLGGCTAGGGGDESTATRTRLLAQAEGQRAKTWPDGRLEMEKGDSRRRTFS